MLRGTIRTHWRVPPRLRSLRTSVPAVALALLAAAGLVAARPAFIDPPNQPADGQEPGQQPDGRVLLINQRAITPAGRQLLLGDLPLNAVLAPDGRHLLVSNSGAGIQSLQVVDTADSTVVQTLPYTAPASVFVGLAYSPDGTRAYASGGGSNVIHSFAVDPTSGLLTTEGDISLGPTKDTELGQAPWPLGLSLSPDGQTLYVAENLANDVAVIEVASGTVTAHVAVGGLPYTTLVSRDGTQILVSNWGDGTISVVDAGSQSVTATIPVGSHPSAMALGEDDLLYVADANSDAVSVVRTAEAREVRRISLAPYPGAPLSSSPEGLALSPDGRTLFVANAGANEVVVVALEGEDGQETIRGRIPTAWYPTSVTPSADGRSLFVTNAKGIGAGPNNNPVSPDPTRKNPPVVEGITGYSDGYCNCLFGTYTGTMIAGTLSTIEFPRAGRLAMYTDQVRRNNRYPGQEPSEDGSSASGADDQEASEPVPAPGQASPIKHVIYILKENRTFDQVFGDESIGDADATLALFPRANTPNLHALAERFGLLDNFYSDAEVSADGHNWATAANATDYNEKMWPQNYSPGVGRNRNYDFEGRTTINLSPGGYLWDAAARANVSYRDYGEFANNNPASGAQLVLESQASTCPGPVAHAYEGQSVPAGEVLCFGPTTVNATTTPNLVGHVDPRFRSYDLRYREADRLAEWEREFREFEANGQLPQLEFLRLPNDHTAGTRPGALTPQAYVAENDLALGKLVEDVSRSRYWSSTAIFVTEDDAQNGPDHVDAHRTTSLVISPYTSRPTARVDHTLYDTAAMLRTMELILGLEPLSQYDANAVPMRALFHAPLAPEDTQPYTAQAESQSLTDVNTANSFGADVSLAMDFEQEDRAPMAQLNQVMWGAIRGANVPYPGDDSPTGGADPQDDPSKD